jgi:hypothetical protein
VPSIGDFKKYLAERFLAIYGPRKLCSFVQRCNGEGPWKETTVLWKKDKWGENKKYIYSKLELEFVQLQKARRAKLPLPEKSLQRYHELLISMSPDLMAKSDEELLNVANEWIARISNEKAPDD